MRRLLLLVLLLISGCASGAAPSPTVPASPPTPLAVAPSSTAAVPPTPAPTLPPTAVPAPTIVAEAGAAPVVGLGPAAPDWSAGVLLREGGDFEVLPLQTSALTATRLAGRPAGWTVTGEMLAYLGPNGDLNALDATSGLTTTVITATEQLRPVAAAWPNNRPLLLYAGQGGPNLELWTWHPTDGTRRLTTLPGVELRGDATLEVSPDGSIVALPLWRPSIERRELVLMEVDSGQLLELELVDGDGAITAIWGATGALAYSLDPAQPITVFRVLEGTRQKIGTVGTPLDWSVYGMLLMTPDDQLLIWKDTVLAKVKLPEEATPAEAARWIGQRSALVLRNGRAERVQLPQL